MEKCQWSENGLCQVFRVRGTDTKPSCNGLKDRKCMHAYNLEDIRDRPSSSPSLSQPQNEIEERSTPTMEATLSMSLAKKVSITAKLDLATGATEYGINLTVSCPSEKIMQLITLLQAEAPVELRFYSPQLALDEVGSHA